MPEKPVATKKEAPKSEGIKKAVVEFQGQKFNVEGTPEEIEKAVMEITGYKNEPSLGKQVKDAFVGAGTEIMRGYHQQNADTYENLAMVDKTGASKAIADNAQITADSLPETNMGSVGVGDFQMPVASMYQTIGRVPGATAEFLMLNKATNALKVPAAIKAAFGDIKATGQMSDAVTLGIQSAINEFRQSDSFARAANAFGSGASTSLVFSIGAEAIPKALEIGKNMGRSAAKAFLKGVTGDEKFAEEFVKNPMKFNLNPFSKVRSFADVEKENTAKMTMLKDELRTKVSDMKFENAEKKAQLSRELDTEMFNLKDKNKHLKESISGKAKVDIDKAHAESTKAFESTVDLVHTSLHDDFNNTLTKVEAIKESYGKQVGQAVDNITNKDPFSRVGMTRYLAKFNEVAEKNGYKLVGGKVTPMYGQGTADEETMRFLQKNLDDVKSVAEFSGIPLEFAQKKKELWQKMGYAGNTPAANVAKQLSGALNPVNLADDIVGNNISKEIGMLKQANKEYSELIPRYDEAIKNFTKTDASGNPIADFQKVLNAVRNNDKTILKQVVKADSLLPVEDRLLPKAKIAASRLSQAEMVKIANVRLAKRKATEEMSKLNHSIREQEFKLKLANREGKTYEAQRLKKKLTEMETIEKAKLQKTIETLEADTEFIRQQQLARSFTPPGTRRTIQAGSVLTALTSAATNPMFAIGGAVGSVALSPKVAAAGTKVAAKTAKPTGEVLLALSQLVNTRIGKVMAVRGLDNDQAQRS